MLFGPAGPVVADQRDMRFVVMVDAGAPTSRVVVAFVQAQVLRILGFWFGSLQHDGPNGPVQQLGVWHIRAGDRDRQRPTVLFHQEAFLHAALGPVRRVGADQAPPFRALPRAPSAACHSQSQPPSSSQASWITAQIRSKIPRATQRWKWRWTVL